MTPRPVGLYLAPFNAPASPQRGDDARLAWEDLPDQIASEDEGVAAMARSVREDAYAEGLAAGAEALEKTLEAERRAFAARLADERAGWAAEEGARLGDALQAALAGIEARIAASVARILRPLIGAALRGKAVDELHNAIGPMLRADQAMIAISGAPDILAALQGRLADAPAGITFTPNASTDVQIVADQTIIESRISAWVGRIEAKGEAS